MFTRDNRLGRWVDEEIGHVERFDEAEFRNFRRQTDDRSAEKYWLGDIEDKVVHSIMGDRATRRAFAVNPDPTHCIVGVQVLVRDKTYFIAWLRSSDVEKRTRDMATLADFASDVKSRIPTDQEIEAIVFTSSLHEEVEMDETEQ